MGIFFEGRLVPALQEQNDPNILNQASERPLRGNISNNFYDGCHYYQNNDTKHSTNERTLADAKLNKLPSVINFFAKGHKKSSYSPESDTSLRRVVIKDLTLQFHHLLRG
jgi:hypothetical protein